MKRTIAILLTFALALPMIQDLRMVEDEACVVAEGGQYIFSSEEAESTYTAPINTQQSILLRCVTLRRFAVVRVKCLRLFGQRPIIHSESARHSEMRSGDVSTMRI